MSATTPAAILGEFLVVFVLALVVSTVSWTVTHEEIARDFREWVNARRHAARTEPRRKFYYLFLCEYCFSHYVALVVLAFTNARLLYPDWRGLVVSFFTMVWLANHSMSLYSRLRLDIKSERLDIDIKETVHDRANGSST